MTLALLHTLHENPSLAFRRVGEALKVIPAVPPEARPVLERVGGTIAANAANAAKPLQDGTPDCGYCPPSPPPIAAIAAQTPQEETPSRTASAAIAAIAAIDSPLLSKPRSAGPRGLGGSAYPSMCQKASTWRGQREGG
jgi:hypothetical protein